MKSMSGANASPIGRSHQEKIAFLPGDGVGPEVLAEARRILELCGRRYDRSFDIVEGDIGGIAIDKYDSPLPPQTVELVKSSQAVLLGAVGGPKYDSLPAPKKPERGLLNLRELLGNYANLRPVFVYDCLADSSNVRTEIVKGVDMVFVRELLGGIYFGTPRSRDENRALDTEVYTVEEVRRVARVAFSLSRSRRRKLTSVDKANVLESSILWRQTVNDVAKEFPDVALDHLYVDNCAMQLILKPKSFDVVVTNNIFGDILSDEGGVLVGSLGMLPSAAIGGTAGLYEPIHGSAPDIAGKSVANPIGAIASVGMMFEHSFGLPEAGACVQKAITQALEKGYRTRDLMPQGSGDASQFTLATTRQMGDVIYKLIESSDAK
jgi:3-isopropylmalate dehydrogenase